jgi:hypothetical protein
MKDYKHLTFTDIEKWCIDNGQVKWLVEQLETPVVKKVYPRVKITNKDGKVVSKADRSQKPKTVSGAPDFVTIKRKWAETFMSHIIPEAKEKTPSMTDKAAALRAKYL